VSAYLLHSGADYRAAGVSLYTHHLLMHLPGTAPQHEYVAFQGKDGLAVPDIRTLFSPIPTVNPALRILWEQTGLPLSASHMGVDLVHGTVNVVPLVFRGPTVVTVHDLSFLRLAAQFPPMKAIYLKHAVDLSTRRATHVIAVSQNTRQDLVDLLNLPEEKISVVYSGALPVFRPLPAAERGAFLQARFGGRPMILHVGTLQPRKNIDVLIRAFAAVRRNAGIPHVLALVGARGWMYENLFTLVQRESLTEHVEFIDFVASEDLPLWYNSADLLAYPSAYEGFGLPVLEAMACGVPVVTSASSSLAELAGGAGITVPPGSQEALELALMRVLDDESLRAEMRARGLARAAQFTWQRTALDTVSVYDQVLNGART
jgi:glycosyltransferase involved in cell wall biosynthesis